MARTTAVAGNKILLLSSNFRQYRLDNLQSLEEHLQGPSMDLSRDVEVNQDKGPLTWNRNKRITSINESFLIK